MFKDRADFEEKLIKAVESDLRKSVHEFLEAKLKHHPGVHEASVTPNHPDHPGHTYVSVNHDASSDEHVASAIGTHGHITGYGDKYQIGTHPKTGNPMFHSQYIVKPHGKKTV